MHGRIGRSAPARPGVPQAQPVPRPRALGRLNLQGFGHPSRACSCVPRAGACGSTGLQTQLRENPLDHGLLQDGGDESRTLTRHEAAGHGRLQMADTGSPAMRHQADLGRQGPRDTKVSFLALARLSVPSQKRPLTNVGFLGS